MPTIVQDARNAILAGVSEHVRSQKAVAAKQVDTALLLASINDVAASLAALPQVPAITNLVTSQVALVKAVQAGTNPLADLGLVLANLYQLRRDLAPLMSGWIGSGAATPQQSVLLDTLLLKAIVQTRGILSARPDVAAVMDDLTAIKELRGGPADAVAFHDFHVLQIAFKSVWLHAFDANLKSAVEQLYDEIVGSGQQSAIAFPPTDAIDDINQLKEFVRSVGGSVGALDPSVPQEVTAAFPGRESSWALLSGGQRFVVFLAALVVLNKDALPAHQDDAKKQAAAVFASPAGPADRVSRLLYEIGKALNEPYAFDVFAPGTYNYGLMVTYRQKWEPGPYQAGDLVSTIPLAPGESRKFASKRVAKEAVGRKVVEQSSQQRSVQASRTSRAESEIMTRATTATNFKMTTHGAFNIGIGSFDVTNEMGANSELVSTSSRKAFHEATLKAAEEYRLERTMEVNSTSSIETEDSSSGEISNPNNEITVTYLFYELQRRFSVSEFLYRVVPVILVAQDVPEPHEIDEAWLLQYQWIIARVLLDESFRPALTYLSSGFAGDEVSLSVLRASWEKQRDLVQNLEALTETQVAMRNALRELIVQQTLQKDKLDNVLSGAMALGNVVTESILAGDFRFQNKDKSDWSAEEVEANRKAAQTRLGYVEEALADSQDKLTQASSAFEAATKEYATAMQNKYNRHVAIDQLRVHVKQNVLYYMQAIYAHEPTDQRYFRLYKQKVICPQPTPGCAPAFSGRRRPNGKWAVDVVNKCVPNLASGAGGHEHELYEVADLDNPLGYKGNYIVFPLIDRCPLTEYMLTRYVDGYLGAKEADDAMNFDAERFEEEWQQTASDPQKRELLKKELRDYIAAVRRATDEIIVPTGQLFIEALPGSHPLLEDFKLEHRLVDVLKARADVRHAELENLRLASRLVEGQGDTALLDDPDVEKKIVVSATGL